MVVVLAVKCWYGLEGIKAWKSKDGLLFSEMLRVDRD